MTALKAEREILRSITWRTLDTDYSVKQFSMK